MKITPELLTKAYTRGIQSALKGLATDGSDLHENYTPPVICDMMLDKLDLTQHKSILVLYNLELLFALKLRKYTGPVTFFTQSPTKAEIAPKFLPGVAVEYIDKEENPLYFMENKWPEKFDIVVANPPYSKYLHLKFLEKCVSIANEKIVFVHPSNSFVNAKGGNQNYVNSNLFLEDKIESLEFFNGNGIFEIDLFAPCSITIVNPNGNGGKISVKNLMNGDDYEVSKISQITQFKNKPQLWSLKEKIDSFVRENGSLEQILKEKNPGPYIVEFTRIRGHIDNKGGMNSPILKDDFFTFIKKNTQVSENQNPKYDLWFRFESENEGKNFISFLKTDFARFALALYKFAQSLNNGELRFVPKLDFTQEWTDEKLYTHFNITEEEQAFIKEVIPPYYD